MNSAYQLVRAIIFNKPPETNWFVRWHQDKMIAVSEYLAEIGSPWGLKDGVHHVQPPLAVLASMVTIRVLLMTQPMQTVA
jgi:hypothetical protein